MCRSTSRSVSSRNEPSRRKARVLAPRLLADLHVVASLRSLFRLLFFRADDAFKPFECREAEAVAALQPRHGALILVAALIGFVFLVVAVEAEQFPVAAIGGIVEVVVVDVVVGGSVVVVVDVVVVGGNVVVVVVVVVGTVVVVDVVVVVGA